MNFEEGWFRFNNLPLDKIFRVLSEHYDVTFLFDENMNTRQLYSINFRTGETDEIIAFLEHAIDIEIEKTGATQYLIKPN
ncbi:MAG: FecR domain-containing protein [Bacteroidota bacterium]